MIVSIHLVNFFIDQYFANYIFCYMMYTKYIGLQNLIQINKQLYSFEEAPSGGVALPFILVQVLH